MIHCSSSRHTRPTPAASLVEVRGKRVPVCAACIQALASNGVQGVIHPLPDPPEPTMATTPTHVDRPFRSTPIDRNGITPNRRLPHVLRPHADDHPELCRVDGCTGKVKARGVCDQHLTMLGKADDTVILLPRADRAEAAKRSAATRAAGKGEPVVVAPVVEQAAPAIPLEDGDGVTPAPAVGGEHVVLVKRNDNAYAWPSGRLAVGESITVRGAWRAWTDSPCEMLPRHFSTPALAAAHLGARLPGEDDGLETLHEYAPGAWCWSSGASAITRTAGDSCLAWRRGERVGKTYDHVTDALIALGARLPDAPGDGEVGAPRVGRSEPPAWRDPFPPGGPTPRERELQAQVEAQAAELADINAILDTTGSAPGQTTPERVRALADYAVETGESVLRAHEALDAAGTPTGGQPADRIRILAERRADPLTPQIRGIVAQILAGMEDRTSGTDGLGIAYDIRALRLAVGIES